MSQARRNGGRTLWTRSRTRTQRRKRSRAGRATGRARRTRMSACTWSSWCSSWSVAITLYVKTRGHTWAIPLHRSAALVWFWDLKAVVEAEVASGAGAGRVDSVINSKLLKIAVKSFLCSSQARQRQDMNFLSTQLVAHLLFHVHNSNLLIWVTCALHIQVAVVKRQAVPANFPIGCVLPRARQMQEKSLSVARLCLRLLD